MAGATVIFQHFGIDPFSIISYDQEKSIIIIAQLGFNVPGAVRAGKHFAATLVRFDRSLP